MIRALYTAASGMSAQQLNLDTIANNLANSSTTGFRQLRLQFQDMVYQNLVTPERRRASRRSRQACRSVSAQSRLQRKSLTRRDRRTRQAINMT